MGNLRWDRVAAIGAGLIVLVFSCKIVADYPWALLVVGAAALAGWLFCRGCIRPRADTSRAITTSRGFGRVALSPVRRIWTWIKRVLLVTLIIAVFGAGAYIAWQASNIGERGLSGLLGISLPGLSSGPEVGQITECGGESCLAVGPLPAEGRLVVQGSGGFAGLGGKPWVFVIPERPEVSSNGGGWSWEWLGALVEKLPW